MTYTGTEETAGGRVFYTFLTGVVVATVLAYILTLDPISLLLIGGELSILEFIAGYIGIHTVRVSPDTLILHRMSHAVTVIMTPDCTGVFAPVVLGLLVLSTPGVRLRVKARVLPVHLLVMLVVNMVRIEASAVAGVFFGPIAFRIIHDTIGGAIMLALALVLWLDWLYREIIPWLRRTGPGWIINEYS
ncbi:exosortase/archaeosortase family protein [Desulfurococcus mucosus]|uniref:Exosortase EpsH-related protein n=1 Tax=Desulfurococcus mucosus (strain ATCC 35584 / DSM 2162 / JCM 9187 / O7/1) TaxID=765177 RepID=E8R8D4_DESM0|nr:exosortase/archaeosortase family protein [Desulfurococcus mucosus]ADV64760.1 hypothetical protein Desmu_0444 [Desulfurococcus mucosus DSM 2162]